MNKSLDYSNQSKAYFLNLWGPKAGLGAAVALLTLAIDQANKLWMLLIYKIGPKERIPINPFLDIVFTKNTGISYSLFDSSSYGWQLTLALIALIASFILWIWICRSGENRLLVSGLGLIIGGAIGNAIDRLWLGGVADFYSLHAFGFYWYIFNLADVAIVAGVILLLYDFYVLSRIDAVKND
ncbi:MAG: signal peptidase II [Hyphomicrobium sp.]